MCPTPCAHKQASAHAPAHARALCFRECVCMHIYVCACVRPCVHACMRACVRAHVCLDCPRVEADAVPPLFDRTDDPSPCAHVRMCTRACVCVRVCTCVRGVVWCAFCVCWRGEGGVNGRRRRSGGRERMKRKGERARGWCVCAERGWGASSTPHYQEDEHASSHRHVNMGTVQLAVAF